MLPGFRDESKCVNEVANSKQEPKLMQMQQKSSRKKAFVEKEEQFCAFLINKIGAMDNF